MKVEGECKCCLPLSYVLNTALRLRCDLREYTSRKEDEVGCLVESAQRSFIDENEVGKKGGEEARNRVDLQKNLANDALPFWEEALLKSLELKMLRVLCL